MRGFTSTDNASLAKEPFAVNSYVGRYRLRHPDQWSTLKLSSTFLPDSVGWLDRSSSDAYLKNVTIKGMGHINTGLILLLTVLLQVLAFWNRRGICHRLVPAVSILVTGVGMFAVTMVCVFFLQRYALPMFVCICIALCLSIDGLLEERRGKPLKSEYAGHERGGSIGLGC